MSRGSLGISGEFTASHYSPEGDCPHEHTWKVLAWFDPPARVDARLYRAAVHAMLQNWNGTLLPHHLMWGEDIARAVGTLNNCVEVIVSREDEGIHARWPA